MCLLTIDGERDRTPLARIKKESDQVIFQVPCKADIFLISGDRMV